MSEPKDTVINAQGSQGFINQPSGPITQNFNTQRQLTCPAPLAPPTHFGGRDTELTHLKQRLKSEETVAITSVEGLGGIGKTTVARQLAYDLYQEGDCFRAVLWLDVTIDFQVCF